MTLNQENYIVFDLALHLIECITDAYENCSIMVTCGKVSTEKIEVQTSGLLCLLLFNTVMDKISKLLANLQAGILIDDPHTFSYFGHLHLRNVNAV